MRRCRRRGWRKAPALVAALAALSLAGWAHGQEIPRLTFAQLGDAIRANQTVTHEIKSYAGKEVEVPFMDEANDNLKLHAVGKSYGLIKLRNDSPHWSIDGT